MIKDLGLPFEKFTLPEELRIPEVKEVLSWQKLVGFYVGVDQFERWKKESWEMAPNVRNLQEGDNKFVRLLGLTSWQLSKFTPTVSDLRTLVGLGGWCTFSEEILRLYIKEIYPVAPEKLIPRAT